MAAGLLLPEDVSPVDAARVLDFLNSVADAATLANTVGFSEGVNVATLVAKALLDRRATAPFATLTDVLDVTGITPARFTEIVVALSGARPPTRAPAQSVVIRPSAAQPLLGQRISLVVQLLDAAGRGVPGVEVTCVATWGTLTARSGVAVQRGSSARLVTEPGGVIRLTLDPPIAPALTDLAQAMLDSELSQLVSAGTSGAAKALGTFADHYRAEAAEPLRDAVDTLFTSFPSDILTADAGWSVIPATVIAFAGGGAADTVGLATIPVRNWLGAFLAVLRDSIANDRRIDQALTNVPLETATGAILARDIYGVQSALAGLERGVLGQKFGMEIASDGLGRFFDQNAAKIDATALIDASRSAGASASAIMTGGFAVFESIGSVQQVTDTVNLRSDLVAGLADQVGLLDQRMSAVETTKADITMVDALSAQLARDAATLDGRISALTASQATKADLVAVNTRLGQLENTQITRSDLTALDGRLGKLETTTATKSDIAALDTRLGRVETTQVTRNDLAALDGRLGRLETTTATKSDIAALDTRLGRVETTQLTRSDLAAITTRVTNLESSQLTQADLTALESRLTQRITTNVATATSGLRTELSTRIDAKADAVTVTALQRSVTGLQTQTTQISTRLDTVDTRVTGISTTRTVTRPGP
ncbi:MAG: hypothetical protein AB7O80_05510 [Acetobacteraceae bacterium]